MPDVVQLESLSTGDVSVIGWNTAVPGVPLPSELFTVGEVIEVSGRSAGDPKGGIQSQFSFSDFSGLRFGFVDAGNLSFDWPDLSGTLDREDGCITESLFAKPPVVLVSNLETLRQLPESRGSIQVAGDTVSTAFISGYDVDDSDFYGWYQFVAWRAAPRPFP